MKKISIIIAVFIASITLMAQVPAGFSYQAVVRSNSGEVVPNKTVKFRFSILQNSSTGTSVYVETQSKATNEFGLANMVVGSGTKVSGSFDPSAWGNNAHFLKVELDPENGSDFSHLGTMQLMAVPYAFHAKTVETIPDNSVTSAKIADGAISSADIANSAVSSAKIADGTIMAADLAAGSVTAEKVAANAITSDKMASDAVSAEKVAANAITEVKIAPGAVTADKIAAGAVTGAKIAQSGATSGQVLKWTGSTWAPAADETGSGGSNPTGPAGGDLTGTYPNPTIGTGKVTGDKLAADAVTSGKILDGTIVTADIAADAVTEAKIALNAITSAKIAEGTIVAADLANSSVTTAKLAATAVTTEKLASNAVSSDKVADQAVTTAKLADNAVTGTKIAQEGATGGQVLKWSGSAWVPGNDLTGGSLWSQNGNNIFYNTGKVGIGKDPGVDLRQFQVLGGTNIAIAAENSSSIYATIYARNNTGTGLAAFFENVSGPVARFGRNIVISDGTQGAGKVLTSDANGQTSWQTPDFSPWKVSGSSIYYSDGKVGVGGINTSNANFMVTTTGSEIARFESTATSNWIGMYTAGVRKGILWMSGDLLTLRSDQGGISFKTNGNYERMAIEDDGDIVTPTTGANKHLLPVAYGYVNQLGQLNTAKSTSNVSSTVTGSAGSYNYIVTVTGVSANSFIALVTPGGSYNSFPRVMYESNTFTVNFMSHDGNTGYANNFSFVVFAP